MPRSFVSLLILCCIAVAACSGGSGTEPPAPPNPSLTLVTQLPAPDTTVEPDATVTVAFDQGLDPASVRNDSLRVADDLGAVEGDASYDAATKSVRWSARFGLTLAARHRVTVSGSLRSAEGTALGTDVEWEFDVRDGAFGTLDPVFGVLDVAMDRSGKAWFVRFDGTVSAGTPGNWQPVLPPSPARPIGVVCNASDEVTVCTTRMWPLGAPNAAGNTQRFVVEALSRNAADAATGWTTVTLLDELCRHATAQFYCSSLGDPIVGHSRTAGSMTGDETIMGSIHRRRVDPAVPNTWRSFPYYNLLPLPVPVDRFGQYVSLGDAGVGHETIVFDDGVHKRTVPLSESLPAGSFLQGSMDAADRLLILQVEAAASGGRQLVARRILAHGEVEPATVLQTGEGGLWSHLATSASGHALSLSFDGPLANDESRHRLHRFDPATGVWTELQPLGFRSRTSDGIVADSRGTFWLALEKATSGGSSVTVYRLRPGDADVQELFSGAGLSSAGLAVDDTGRAMLRTNMGLVRFQ